MVEVKHCIVNNPEEVEALFEKALESEYEGVILRNPHGRYKFGRASLGQNIIFKVKPFVTLDAKLKKFYKELKLTPMQKRKLTSWEIVSLAKNKKTES